MAASSSTLAAKTLGFTRGAADRETRADLVGDGDAYLGLTGDGVAAGGVLFGGGSRPSPATFAVVNRLTESLSLAVESDRFRFETSGGAITDDGRRLLVDDDAGDTFGPGERLGPVTVRPTRAAIASAVGSTVTGTIDITADGEETRIDAERDLSLEVSGIDATRALLALTQRGGGVFEHRWRLEAVETTGRGLETLRLDYRAVETAGAIDFTAAESLSASIAVDGTERACSIDRTRSHRLAVSLADPVAIDRADVELVLTGTGGPASPGGGPGRPTGATVELLGAGFSTRLEAIRSHPGQ